MSEVINAPEEEKPEIDEYEQSAAMFHHLSLNFRRNVYQLANRKKRAPVRVLEAILFNPLEEVKLLGKEEKNLFDLCTQIIYHKAKIMEYVQIEKQKEQEVINYNNPKGETNESNEK